MHSKYPFGMEYTHALQVPKSLGVSAGGRCSCFAAPVICAADQQVGGQHQAGSNTQGKITCTASFTIQIRFG